MFKPVLIEITNSFNFFRENEPVTIGIPCPKGKIFNRDKLKLEHDGQCKQFHLRQMAKWPDGSLKWFLLDFQVNVDANGKSPVLLHYDESIGNDAFQLPDSLQIVISDFDEKVLVDTGPAQFSISKHKLGLFEQVLYDNTELLLATPGPVQLVDEEGHLASSVITAINFTDSGNSLRKKAVIDGCFQSVDKKNLVDFSLQLTFYAGKSTVKCELSLLNSQAAKHPGGVWDLGDKGSFFFKELSVKIQLAKTEHEIESSIRISPDTEWRVAKTGTLQLYQESSGGKNWQSKNHMNAKGEVPLEFKGYRYFEQDKQLANGDRASPIVNLSSGETGITAHIDAFWQNFPKSIQVDQATMSLNLFPRRSSDGYELQGGERKKHTFYLDFSNNKTSLDSSINDITVRVSLDYYSDTKVIPWLARFHKDSVMQKLIDRGIQGDNNFFDKREAIDEFGWRNFGEIFADHEGLEYKGNDELISHYNNQYDPLYGFIKQYLITGDNRWHELLSELAQHIVDIDIYHTVKDRDEYNGGLFWHTHHYLNAFTCTHRTFSSKHAADFLYGEIGGGPGAEHCYSTGLACYYFITGDKVYKEAALKLVNWVSRVLEGSGTVIERVFQFKSKELPILKRLISGETIQRYSYPFTRGTGNYITSLIDAYSLTGERHYLVSVERVIHQSIHPLDDISLRNLHDTESSWSYLIFLQAVCKYLDLKINIQDIDQACLYAKDCLLHYVDWMIENESPFLQNPEKLEYPNHTWTAQDLRKASIFYIASLYSEKNKTKYLEAARFYVQFVEDTLEHEETRYYSRILILLMQNCIQESGLDYNAARLLRNLSNLKSYSPAPLYSASGIFLGFLRDIGSRVFKLSFKNEWRWLSFRMK